MVTFFTAVLQTFLLFVYVVCLSSLLQVDLKQYMSSISRDRVDTTNASVVDSLQPSIEGNSAAARALVSPPVENSAHASEESREDVVRVRQ